MPTIYVFSRNMKNIRGFLSENFQFLEVKFSIYLNRHVFVMLWIAKGSKDCDQTTRNVFSRCGSYISCWYFTVDYC